MEKGRILIVDEGREFLDKLKKTLKLSCYDVFGVVFAESFQEKAGKFLPDVFVMDLEMDTMSGFEVTGELKSFSSTETIPIIAMTGFFNEEEYLCA
jgi:DNA-binding response OmpR family regulator